MRGGFFHALLFFLIVSEFLATEAKAQVCGSDAQSPISTDRPQVTSSSIVIPCESLQFENGFQVTSNDGHHSYDFPEISVRYGIARKAELRLTAPNYNVSDPITSEYADGFSDLSLGFKQQLGPTRGGFDLSIIPSVSLPTGAKAISSHGYDPTIQLPWSHSLSKNWTAAGMLSLMWPTEGPRRNLTVQSSLYFDRQLTQAWDAYAEYSAAFPQRGGPQNTIDFGTAYKISPHQQFDFHWNIGLSSAMPDSILGFGYSARFQVVHMKHSIAHG